MSCFILKIEFVLLFRFYDCDLSVVRNYTNSVIYDVRRKSRKYLFMAEMCVRTSVVY